MWSVLLADERHCGASPLLAIRTHDKRVALTGCTTAPRHQVECCRASYCSLKYWPTVGEIVSPHCTFVAVRRQVILQDFAKAFVVDSTPSEGASRLSGLMMLLKGSDRYVKHAASSSGKEAAIPYSETRNVRALHGVHTLLDDSMKTFSVVNALLDACFTGCMLL